MWIYKSKQYATLREAVDAVILMHTYGKFLTVTYKTPTSKTYTNILYVFDTTKYDWIFTQIDCSTEEWTIDFGHLGKVEGKAKQRALRTIDIS